MSDFDEAKAFSAALDAVVKQYDADVMAYVGYLFEPYDRILIDLVRSRSAKRKNVLLILSTPGGSADVAYRIARALQRSYRTRDKNLAERGQFFIYVHDWCTSAGTILSLGASMMIMSQKAQLGPIDVQLRRDDEVGERRSGLTSRQALETLSTEAGRAFKRLFRYMRFDPDLQLSTKMAADLAARITVGVMEPVYAQLDPMRVGEVERFVQVAQEYGERLRTQNVSRETIEKLLGSYPSHEFVIDREEAESLFNRVEKPSDDLEIVAEIFIRDNHPTADDDQTYIEYVNDAPSQAAKEAQDVQSEQQTVGQNPAGAGSDGRQIRPDATGDSSGQIGATPAINGHLEQERDATD